MQLDVCGLGNALMDVLIRLDDDAVLKTLGLRKGIMHLVDAEAWSRAYEAVRHLPTEVSPGGSCANTISTLSLLGAHTLFCGQVADDDLGHRYGEALTGICGGHRLHTVGAATGATGRCLSLISADGERTMLTCLGVAIELAPEHLFREALGHGKTLHLTGYQFTGGRMGDTAREALEVARHHGVKVSFDVADPFVIRFHRELIWEIIERYADIVFTNEEEARALCELPPLEAAHELAQHTSIAVVKMGSRGSVIQRGTEVVTVGIHRVEAVDTTGAGDAYAGGLLYGLSREWSLERAGHLAARVAAETVAQTGAVVHRPGALRDIAAGA